MNQVLDPQISIRRPMAAQAPTSATNVHQPYTVSELECVVCDDPKPVITVEHLSVAYDGVNVLKDVSLRLNDGCITALIGPSGCGKTTFLSCLNRLIDFAPNSSVKGSVRIGDTDIWHSSVDVIALRRRVGMVFQRPNPFPLSIRRNLEMPLNEHGVRDRQEIDGRIEQTLCDVGLWNEVKDKLNRSALSLSGGQQQRLCIARALILEPSILLMDEPCSALDPMSSTVVEDLISQMRGRYTVVIVTHNLAQAKRIANYVAFFWMHNNAGALVEFGRCQHIFESPSSPLTADYVSGLRG